MERKVIANFSDILMKLAIIFCPFLSQLTKKMHQMITVASNFEFQKVFNFNIIQL